MFSLHDIIHRHGVLKVISQFLGDTMTVGLIDAVDLGIQYTADELDEKRQNRSAYDYLCRLYEVRK